MTVFLIISRGPTLFIFLYMSFAYAAHDECSCLSYFGLRIERESATGRETYREKGRQI